MKTKTVPFDIYIPASEHQPAVKVDTIDIEVAIDENGHEMITANESLRIDKIQSSYIAKKQV